MSEQDRPTEGASAADKLHNLRWKNVDVSGVPDRQAGDEEKAAAIQGIKDAKTAKELVARAIDLAVGLGAKFLAG